MNFISSKALNVAGCFLFVFVHLWSFAILAIFPQGTPDPLAVIPF